MLMLQRPECHLADEGGGYHDTLRTTVHTSIHKEYKGNGPYRPLKNEDNISINLFTALHPELREDGSRARRNGQKKGDLIWKSEIS